MSDSHIPTARVTDEHFAKASEAAPETGGAESGAASARKAPQDVAPSSGEDSVSAPLARPCDSVQDDATQCEEVEMGDTGLEQVSDSPRNAPAHVKTGAESGAMTRLLAPEVDEIVATWRFFPHALRAALLTIIRTPRNTAGEPHKPGL